MECLSKVTDDRSFEHFCHDLLESDGWRVDPRGGSGDEGRDAVCTRGNLTMVACFTTQQRGLKRKLLSDCDKIKGHGHKTDGIIFCTTTHVSERTRRVWEKALKSEFGWSLEPYNLERIVTLVDAPGHKHLQWLHPNILPPLLPPALEGLVEPITRSRLERSATPEQIKGFLEGERVCWDVVVADGSVKREQTNELVERLKQPPARTRVLCIVGETGAGKTTLTRQATAQLCFEHKMPIFHALMSGAGRLWGLLPLLAEVADEPLVLLFDDLFHDDGFSVLRNTDTALPITILTTAWPADYDPRSLPFEKERLDIKDPTWGEKCEMVRRVGRRVEDLSQSELDRLRAATEFFVLALETTTGKGLPQYVEERMNSLKHADEQCWNAYGYVAWSWAHETGMPASLLSRLCPEPHEIWMRSALEGLVLPNERPGHLEGRNPRFCLECIKALGCSPVLVVTELLKAADGTDYLHRRYIAHLLRSIAGSAPNTCREVLRSQKPLVKKLIKCCTAVSEAVIWARMFQILGMPTEDQQCLELAMACKPISEGDLGILWSLLSERNRETEFLSALEVYMNAEPNSAVARVLCISSIEVCGTKEQKATAIEKTNEWLERHSEDISVRTKFLGLVQAHGTDKQLAKAIRDTTKWLKHHRGEEGAKGVWWDALAKYLALIRKSGTGLEASWALRLAEEEMRSAGPGGNLFPAYLALVKERRMDAEINRQAVKDFGNAFVQSSPSNSNVIEDFAKWLYDIGDHEEARNLYAKLLEATPKNYNAHYGYGRILYDEGDFARAKEQFIAALSIHKGHQMARDGLAWSLYKEGNSEEAIAELNHAIWWAQKHNWPVERFYTSLGRMLLDLERIDDSLNAFAKGSANDWYNLYGMGKTLKVAGRPMEALEYLKTARELAPKPLLPPASEEIPGLIAECEEALREEDRLSTI